MANVGKRSLKEGKIKQTGLFLSEVPYGLVNGEVWVC